MMTGIEISSDYLGVRNEEGKLIVRITHIDFINMTVTTHKGEVHPFSGVFTVLDLLQYIWSVQSTRSSSF
jgi:hypothetical protein